MEKFLEYLSEAQKITRACDHMIYISFPLIKDKNLLIKILIELKKAIAYSINSILQYEYIFKKIKLYKDSKTNFETFMQKSSKRFEINKEEIKKILEIFEIVEFHKKSPIQFPKNNKIIILSENMNHKTISLEKIKEFLILTKQILKKIEQKIKA